MSFVGISNWALDPAKMNRGILVSRGVPTKEDLKKSANGICSNHKRAKQLMSNAIEKLTEGYDFIHKKQEREYFGLRDFYSVIKMVFAIAKDKLAEPTKEELQLAVQRNFGGYFGNFDPAVEFLRQIDLDLNEENKVTSKELILEAIQNEAAESR